MNLTPQDLEEFTGTSQYFQYKRFKFTDGVKYFVDTAGAYWFLDIIWTEILRFESEQEFMAIQLDVADSQATIKVHDGNNNYFFEKNIPFTDCPTANWLFYLTNNVMLVPSEY